MDDLTHDALKLMKDTGGSFASSLAEAWLHADGENTKRLYSAFPDLLASYRDQVMADLSREYEHLKREAVRLGKENLDLRTERFKAGDCTPKIAESDLGLQDVYTRLKYVEGKLVTRGALNHQACLVLKL